MKTINSIILSINLFNILCYNVDLIQGIRGGVDVPDGKFKYQAIILINGRYACGGALLNSGNIISAGQCVLDEQGYFLDVTFEVIVGITCFHPGDTSGSIKVDYIYVKSTFRPKDSSLSGYSFPNYLEYGDIAVLKLRFQISNRLNVDYVQLPQPTGTTYQKYFYKTLNISGFGLSTGVEYKSASDLSNIRSRLHIFGQLTYMETMVLREDTCQRHYGYMRPEHMCAKSVDSRILTGPCRGDTGGPLIFNNVIAGVLQYYVDDCDNRNLPAVYTRISPYIPFIENARDDSYQNDMRLGNYTGPHVIEVPRNYRG